MSKPFVTATVHPQIFGGSADAYHALEYVSNSKLSDFLDDPLLYYHYYVARDWKRPPATPAMEFGTLIHEILPPGSLSNRVVIVPRGVLNKDGHRKGAMWTAFTDEHEGKLLLKPEEAEPYLEIRRAAEEHPLSFLLRDAERVECNLTWTHAETGLPLKSRLDRLHLARACIVDIKTTTATDWQSFANEVGRYGYHRQAAFYRMAAKAVTGIDMPFLFCAVRKSRPYTIQFFNLTDEFLRRGDIEVQQGLVRLKECMDSGCWDSPAYGEIITLCEPKWLTYQEAWTL